MWHHYANGHEGLCLVFDREKLDASFKRQIDKERLFSSTVTYSDQGAISKLSNDPFSVDFTQVDSEEKLLQERQEHFNKWNHNLFFTKLKDWSNEEEYRWIYFDNNKNKTPRDLKFDDALAAIVIGECVSKDHDEAILTYCAHYKADIAKLEWRNGLPILTNLGNPYITHKHLLNNCSSD